MKHYACLLIHSEQDEIPQYNIIAEKLEEIYSQLDNTADAHSEYILCSILAYIEKQKGNLKYGENLLLRIEKYAILLGEDYQIIYFHNRNNINNADKVTFAFVDIALVDNVYYLDPRIW